MTIPNTYSRRRFVVERMPELCGAAWLIILAAGIWLHTHATNQPPIYDAFGYYQKAYNFWAAVRSGRLFNPLNIEPTFRPPGTVLMSYPFGFSFDPRGFYFRSIYFPAALLFSSVMIAAYDPRHDRPARSRVVLTAIFFTSVTLLYQFAYGARPVFWGLVDSFLTGLAALAAASAWRGTQRSAHILAWAVLVSGTSIICVVVKPAGALVAAVAGLGWVGLGLASLIEERGKARQLPNLLAGAAMIGLGDLAIVLLSLHSGYLSRQNLSYGAAAIGLMQQWRVPFSALWAILNAGLGLGLVLWTCLVAVICAWVGVSKQRSVMAARNASALLAAFAALLVGIWFWFVGSGSITQIRYDVPFFMMALVWLVPLNESLWITAPVLLRWGLPPIMVATSSNLALLLWVHNPSLTWQQFSGVGITSDFPAETLAAFNRLIAEPANNPRILYIFSFDANDAMLEGLNDQNLLGHPGVQPWSVLRPVDWLRSSTVRLNEVEEASVLIVNPQQAAQAPAGPVVKTLADEQGVYTVWADALTASDGVTVFYASPTVKILSVFDPARLRASLDALVSAHIWDPSFVAANRNWLKS